MILRIHLLVQVMWCWTVVLLIYLAVSHQPHVFTPLCTASDGMPVTFPLVIADAAHGGTGRIITCRITKRSTRRQHPVPPWALDLH